MNPETGTPRWIAAILSWPWILPVARVALVSAFLIGGIQKLTDFPGAVAEQAHFGLQPAWLWAATAIVVELGGSLLVIANRLVWLGAGGLGVLTAVAMLTANDFWAKMGHDRFMAINAFFEHLGLIAGLVLVSVLSLRKRARERNEALMLNNRRLIEILLISSLAVASPAMARHSVRPSSPPVGVGAQYDTTHVYVAPEDVDKFVASFLGTFGGQSTKQVVATVTPTPSSTTSQLLQTPVGTVSLFGFKTPIPYPFGAERTGYLVTDLDKAIKAAKTAGADVLVSTFPDPIGRDAVIQWPGGVNMQLYWHTTAPNYATFQTVPENRVYVSPHRVDEFVRSFLKFSHGKVVSDNAHAPGVEIGRAKDTYRRVRIESVFGKVTVIVTDGHLPYPYGRELTGYEVADLAGTIAKAKAAGASVLVEPFTSDRRHIAMIQFPGGYVAEVYAQVK
jgi:uncharacterized membrane protein YphA (DoxX/SURF4 family)/predicted enzyme related to lactoylglutathione lyase